MKRLRRKIKGYALFRTIYVVSALLSSEANVDGRYKLRRDRSRRLAAVALELFGKHRFLRILKLGKHISQCKSSAPVSPPSDCHNARLGLYSSKAHRHHEQPRMIVRLKEALC